MSNHQELTRLYAEFEAADLNPLWMQREDLMTSSPRPKAVPVLMAAAREAGREL
jgi:gentisate 1,2-dioxygenase